MGPAYGLGKKTVDSWIGPIRALTIGDEMIQDTTLHFADLYKDATFTPGGSRIARKVDELQPMLIGADFLRSHRVLVAHSQRRMYFTYVGGPVFQTAAAAQQCAAAVRFQTLIGRAARCANGAQA